MKKKYRKRAKDSARKVAGPPRERLLDPAAFLPNAIIALGALVLLLPLVVHPAYFVPFVFLKSILFRAVVELMFFLYVVLAVLVPAYRPRWNRVSAVLLGYFAVRLISSLPGISSEPWSSWWGDFRRMGGMVTELHLAAYFAALSQALRREREWIVLFATALFATVLMGLSGLTQILELDFPYPLQHDVRIRGATGNAAFFGGFMVLSLGIALWLATRKDKETAYPICAKVWVWLLVVLDAILIAMEVTTGSASAPGLITVALRNVPVGIYIIALHALVILWFAMRRSVLAGYLISAAVAVSSLFWIYRSQTRGAMVAVLVALVFVAAVYLVSGRRPVWRVVNASFLLVAVAAPAALFLSKESAWVQSRPTLVRLTRTDIQDEASILGRLEAWKAAAQAIGDRPLLGWGPENYKNAFDRHFPSRIYQENVSETWFDRSHNTILEVASTSGLAGLVAYFLLQATVLLSLLSAWLRTRDYGRSLGIAGIYVAYLAQSLFTFDTTNTDGIVYLLLAYISYLWPASQPAKVENPSLAPARLGSVWIGVAAILTFVSFRVAVSRIHEANIRLVAALASKRTIDQRTGAPLLVYGAPVVAQFETANRLQATGRFELREQFANYAAEVAAAPHITLAQKADAVSRAAAFLEESTIQAPENARYYMYRASLINRATPVLRLFDAALARGLLENNLVFLESARRLSPTRPHVFFETGQTLVLLGRLDEAAAVVERGVALAPAVKSPNMDLVSVYIAAGHYDKAEAHLQEMKRRGIVLERPDYERMIRDYTGRGQFARVIELYREQLAGAPEDLSLLSGLVAACRESGQVELAREPVARALALSGGTQPQIRQLLESLTPSP